MENFLGPQVTLNGCCRKNYTRGGLIFFHNLNKHGQLVSGTRRSGRSVGRFGRNRPLKHSQNHTFMRFFCRLLPRQLWPFVTAREVMGKKLFIIVLMHNGPLYPGICVPRLSDKRSGHTSRIINRQNRRFFTIFATFDGRCRPNGWSDRRQPHIR